MPAEKPRAPTDLARWADRCLRLYPRAWRLRYREEMLALLDRHRGHAARGRPRLNL